MAKQEAGVKGLIEKFESKQNIVDDRKGALDLPKVGCTPGYVSKVVKSMERKPGKVGSLLRRKSVKKDEVVVKLKVCRTDQKDTDGQGDKTEEGAVDGKGDQSDEDIDGNGDHVENGDVDGKGDQTEEGNVDGKGDQTDEDIDGKGDQIDGENTDGKSNKADLGNIDVKSETSDEGDVDGKGNKTDDGQLFSTALGKLFSKDRDALFNYLESGGSLSAQTENGTYILQTVDCFDDRKCLRSKIEDYFKSKIKDGFKKSVHLADDDNVLQCTLTLKENDPKESTLRVTIYGVQEKVPHDRVMNGVNIKIETFGEYSSESKDVEAREVKLYDANAKLQKLSRDVEKFKEKFLSFQTETELRRNHSNLNYIAFSCFKSTAHGTKEWSTYSCDGVVVFYCSGKGYIPYGEQLFPKKIGTFYTDVREGVCVFTASNNCMGKKIYSDTTGKRCTLGGLVELDDGSDAFLTCAHVSFSAHELEKFDELWEKTKSDTFYDAATKQQIGKIHETYFAHRVENSLDVSLVKIENKSYIQGESREKTDSQLDKEENKFLSKISPELLDLNNVNRWYRAMKFGADGKATYGKIQIGNFNPVMHDVPIEVDDKIPKVTTFVMRNQILISPIDRDSFAEAGDSGSLIFLVPKEDQAVPYQCIGMLIGRTTSGQGIMTPIRRIMNALNLTHLKIPRKGIIEDIRDMVFTLRKDFKTLEEKVSANTRRIENISQ